MFSKAFQGTVGKTLLVWYCVPNEHVLLVRVHIQCCKRPSSISVLGKAQFLCSLTNHLTRSCWEFNPKTQLHKRAPDSVSILGICCIVSSHSLDFVDVWSRIVPSNTNRGMSSCPEHKLCRYAQQSQQLKFWKAVKSYTIGYHSCNVVLNVLLLKNKETALVCLGEVKW